ncbi:MAG: hypothetical protein J5495_00980 [Bacteroidales bacterium]|nr:hypothetical protein [Bacteroidales bacterium]
MERKTAKAKEEMSEVKVNPLRKEKIYVRWIPKDNGLPNRHVASGGKVDGAYDSFVVPMLRNGQYKNVLTDAEKDFLEEALGLDYNALSVYKKEDNFWDNYRVRIDNAKEGIHLDLSNPDDYIRYKVLLANSDDIAPSVQERIDRPKNTYRYELVRESDEDMIENAKMDATMQSYKEFGKIENDLDTMRVLVELLDARPYSANEKAVFLKSRINQLIGADPKKFLATITDPLLHAKVLIRRGTEVGVLAKRGDYYFLKSDNSPLCDGGENPTLSIAARYINLPAHQDIKFILESEIGKNRNA